MGLKKSVEKKNPKNPEKNLAGFLKELVSPSQKDGRIEYVNKSIEKKETTSSGLIETKELGKSNEKKQERGFIKWMGGGALGLLGLSVVKKF